MAQAEWFRNWFNSPYYHQLYFERNEQEAGPFIENLLAQLQPAPGSRLLDAGCGKGRHSRLLAAKGFDVTGVDLAPDSIREAHKAEQEHLHFYQHDLRLPFWIRYFDVAFSFFTSFGYFATRREHDDAMRTLAASLKQGGILVFDYLNVHFVEERFVHHEQLVLGNTHYELHRWHDDTHFFKKIIITDPSLSHPLTFTEQVAKFSLGDFTDMLSFQRLQVTEVFGDHTLQPYHVRNTPRMIVIARK